MESYLKHIHFRCLNYNSNLISKHSVYATSRLDDYDYPYEVSKCSLYSRTQMDRQDVKLYIQLLILGEG